MVRGGGEMKREFNLLTHKNGKLLSVDQWIMEKDEELQAATDHSIVSRLKHLLKSNNVTCIKVYTSEEKE